MAVTNDGRGPVLAGARLVPGSASLILLRWFLLALAAAPALIAGAASAGRAARLPYVTSGAPPLPLAQTTVLWRELAPAAAAGVAIAALLALVLDQVLTAGALAFFDPARPGDVARGFRRRVWARGLSRFWAFVRILGWGLLAGATVAGIVRAATNALQRRGERLEWSAWSLRLALPLGSAALTLLLVAVVLAIVFWTKVVTVADDRRRTRRALLIACRVVARRPFAGLLFFVVLATLASALPALALWAWRRSPAGGPGGAVARFALVCAATLAAAVAWHWMVRAGRLLYADTRLDDLRAQPDEPFRFIARLRARVRRRPADPPAPPPDEVP